MAIPRPILIALLGLVLCAGAFVATRGSADNAGTAAPPALAAPAPKAVHTAPGTVAHKPAKPAVASKPHASAKAHTPVTHKAVTHKAVPRKAVTHKAPAKATPAQVEQAKVDSVLAAFKRGDVVVLLFTSSGSADDAATRQSVAALHGLKHVTVVSAGLGELAAFRPILQGAGVSQVPAVVVAHGQQGARLIQGFVDANTLRQTVADARR